MRHEPLAASQWSWLVVGFAILDSSGLRSRKRRFNLQHSSFLRVLRASVLISFFSFPYFKIVSDGNTGFLRCRVAKFFTKVWQIVCK